jgi:hypothetical protein
MRGQGSKGCVGKGVKDAWARAWRIREGGWVNVDFSRTEDGVLACHATRQPGAQHARELRIRRRLHPAVILPLAAELGAVREEAHAVPMPPVQLPLALVDTSPAA